MGSTWAMAVGQGFQGAAVTVEVSAAGEDQGADARVQSGCKRGVKATHRVSNHCNAFGIDLGKARGVTDSADDVTDHEAAHPRGGFEARKHGVVGTSVGEMLRVALFLADGIEGYDDRAGACIEEPGVDLV